MKLVSTFAWMSFHSEGIKPYVKLEWYRKDPRYVDIWELVLQVLHRLLLSFVMVWWGGYHGFLFGARFAALFLGLLAMPHWVKGLWILCSTRRFRKMEMSGNFKKHNKHLICSLCGGIFDSCNKTAPDINHAVVLDGYGTEYLKQQSFGRKERQRYSITWWLGGHVSMIWYDLIVVFGIYMYIYVSNWTNTCRCM